MTNKMTFVDNENLKVWWDENNSIARVRGIGTVDEENARLLVDATNQVAQKYGDDISWLADMSNIITSTSGGRKVVSEAMKHPSIKAYAMYGASVFVRTVANFINVAAGLSNAKHFSNEEDALQWIKGGSPSKEIN